MQKHRLRPAHRIQKHIARSRQCCPNAWRDVVFGGYARAMCRAAVRPASDIVRHPLAVVLSSAARVRFGSAGLSASAVARLLACSVDKPCVLLLQGLPKHRLEPLIQQTVRRVAFPDVLVDSPCQRARRSASCGPRECEAGRLGVTRTPRRAFRTVRQYANMGGF